MDWTTSAGGRPGSDGEHTLQRILGTETRADRFYADHVRDRLNDRMVQFIACRELVFISTSDSRGACDASFRAGPPGFVVVLDEQTLAYPDGRGHGVMASLGNMAENAHVGLLFLDFAEHGVGLRVNGTATVRPDRDMRRDHPWLRAAKAEMWVTVTVREAFEHPARVPRFAPLPPTEGVLVDFFGTAGDWAR